MASAFIVFAVGGILVYGLSTTSATSTLRVANPLAYSIILGGFGVYLVSTGFLLSPALSMPS